MNVTAEYLNTIRKEEEIIGKVLFFCFCGFQSCDVMNSKGAIIMFWNKML